jgi:Na+-translocating ferredoxin:NAD+ oxidoreductase RnfC subunit
MIIEILKNIGLKNILAILFCLVCFSCGYWCCSVRYSTLITEYKLNAEKQKNQLLQEISQQEQFSRETIAIIERENLEKQEQLKNEYESIIANMHDNYVLRDSVQCNDSRSAADVQETKSNTGDLRCYTEAELYRKIERSLAIGQECDKLANDYNALVKVCKVD